MNRMELLSDRIAAAHLDRRRNRELQRQERIFNTKVRTIGIDVEALQHQVQEKRAQQESEAKALKEYADDLIRTDCTARLLESRQKQDERLLAEAIDNFRQQFQQPSSRREFDLNDPEALKKQEGVRILPGLVGEDMDNLERTRRQQEQLRDWTLQQQQELNQAKELQRLQAQQYDQSTLSLDTRALELQKMEEEYKRATNIKIQDFNRALADKLRAQREREHWKEEENNQSDNLNHLQGELLSESIQQSARVHRDCYKGITPEQIREFTNCQRQQAEEKRRVLMEQRKEQLQEDRLLMASARAALLQERQQARMNKELRRAVDETNLQLAQAQHAQRKKEVYTSIPDESFFSQFNKCSR
ncbi:RIB43A-like with coiled-coils protein 2 isoform X2 [Ictalurus furcatus]|uniref:RIB43A-like with coiled-coils protein 2 isoform X2 n=1 Tax=Ictalurus furcatus TaxID=66913 RepID=UPI00234FC2D1|nr:RIB43A-like with coiled-coils protein 2 isoform X2 [Ictalurus furcatus]